MPELIVFRAVQGLGAGAVQPCRSPSPVTFIRSAERARVQGYIASVWGASSVVGPAVGGLFAQLHLWRWIFFVNVPLCLLAGPDLAQLPRTGRLPEAPDRRRRRRTAHQCNNAAHPRRPRGRAGV